jgi:hypothetical protein
MAHFAQLDENNIVLQVIVVDNNDLMFNGIESEVKGIEFCQSLFGGNWVQTSYNRTFRKNYAGIGYTYDSTRNAFIAPQPDGVDWTFDEETCLWRNIPQEQAEEAIRIGITRV